MALLDLPAPLFNAVDRALIPAVPGALRLALWGALGGVLAMLLYWALSPQAAIAEAKRERLRARRALENYEGEFADAGPLLGAMLWQSLRHVGLVLAPTLAAALPVLALMTWLGNGYGYLYPTPSLAVKARAVPDRFAVNWRNAVAGPGNMQHPAELVVRDSGGTEVGAYPLRAAVPVLHKRGWWNRLVAENPAGYLPDEAPLQRIEIALPRQEFTRVGPLWSRHWEALFFTALTVAALVVRFVFRIH